MNTSSPARSVQRVRHTLKARRLTVSSVQRISPNFVRVRLIGDELRDFVSASFDDHLKLVLPSAPGQPLVLPEFGVDGAARPLMRDYTPRWFDTARGELDIEFALHGTGPAADWAAQARPGQEIGIAGPRGSMVVPLDYDWHLLIGDETALPAIARRLEELPARAGVTVLVQTGDPADQRSFEGRDVRWVASGELLAAVRALKLPSGEGYAWAAGEAATMAAVRRLLVDQHGLDKDHIRAAAYWKQGAVAHHENL